MLRKIAKAVAYTKAPKKTFMVLHPRKALAFGAGLFLVRKGLKLARKGV